MKIAVCSDVHLEFGPISLENTEDADVLILSGDICVAKDLCEKDMNDDKSKKYHTFFQECCERFPHVIYIMGNHEYYHGDFAKSLTNIRTHLGYLWNLHILENEFLELKDAMFFGATLWTDMNKEDPVTLQHIKGYMNDYRIIDNSNRVSHFRDNDGNSHTRVAKFSPEDTVIEHKKTMQILGDAIDSRPDMPWVVVGHHAPSKASVKPRYAGDFHVNGAYSSDLSEFILDRPQIKLWTHGHTHDVFDYMIGSTRIVCNPRGYIYYENRADEFELKFIEV
jgi:predicted phosphodiesterase